MQRRAPVLFIFTFAMVCTLLFPSPPVTATEPPPSTFSFSGKLSASNVGYTGACDMQFDFFDQAQNGVNVATTQVSPGVNVTGGLFDVAIPYAPLGVGLGVRTWLAMQVKCGADAGFTALLPRLELTGVPLALGLRNGVATQPVSGVSVGLSVANNAVISGTGLGVGILGTGIAGGAGILPAVDRTAGVVGLGDTLGVEGRGFYVGGRFESTASQSTGVIAKGGVAGDFESTLSGGIGVSGFALGTGSVAVSAETDLGQAVQAVADGGIAVQATSFGAGSAIVANAGSGYAGDFEGPVVVNVASLGSLTGVAVASPAACCDQAAVKAQTTSDGIGVWGIAGSTNSGVYGQGEVGVVGETSVAGHAGVLGRTNGVNGYGVQGVGTANVGVFGQGHPGVIGEATANGTYGVLGRLGSGVTSGYAGWFQGDVNITGTLTKGLGAFKIDHPLDPANKTLSHSFVESPDMKNVYDGVVTTDESGRATVVLPDWFEALNRDFRYQLTTIGRFARAMVAEKIRDNRFVIATDEPFIEVSWQVTGIRHDPLADAHRIVVEEEKPPAQRGTYLNPEVYRGR